MAGQKKDHIKKQELGAAKARALIHCFIAFCFIACFMEFTGCPSSGRLWVRRVIDGDTIVLSDGRHVRYIGINTPEIAHGRQPGQAFGRQARMVNKGLVQGRRVILRFDKERKDRYDRTLAYVFLENGCFVNEKLLEQGMAWVYMVQPNRRYAALFLKIQQKAMDHGRGMWSNWQEEPARFVGNLRSMRVHAGQTRQAKSVTPKNRVIFESLWDALYAGFAPTRQCLENSRTPLSR